MKKIYLIILIIIGLCSIALYSTYAMFTSSVETDIVNMDTSMTYKFKINGTQQLKVSAGSKLRFNAEIENDMDGTISYGLYYKMISPTTLPSNVIIAQVSDNLTSVAKGTITTNNSVTVPIVIKNTSDSDITVEIGVRTGYATESQGVDDIIYNEGEIPITDFQTSEEAGNDSCIATKTCTSECVERKEDGYLNTYCYCLESSKELPPLATEKITKLLANNPTTMNKDDPDGNIRYMGANPNNYVKFNNELWRIIGVFDVKSSETGQTEKRLKIIRNESLGVIMEWDIDGSNNWTTSSLNTYLNETYYNTIDQTYKNLIGETYWNLGGTAEYTTTSNGLANHWYEYERGTDVYSGRPTYWVGKIGLMYPSDYGYATSGGTTTNRASCLAKELYNWNDSNYIDCKNNDYLYDSEYFQWTLTPVSNNFYEVFIINTVGNFNKFGVDYFRYFYPVLYLNSNVTIIGGDGTYDNAFTLGQ